MNPMSRSQVVVVDHACIFLFSVQNITHIHATICVLKREGYRLTFLFIDSALVDPVERT